MWNGNECVYNISVCVYGKSQRCNGTLFVVNKSYFSLFGEHYTRHVVSVQKATFKW